MQRAKILSWSSAPPSWLSCSARILEATPLLAGSQESGKRVDRGRLLFLMPSSTFWVLSGRRSQGSSRCPSPLVLASVSFHNTYAPDVQDSVTVQSASAYPLPHFLSILNTFIFIRRSPFRPPFFSSSSFLSSATFQSPRAVFLFLFTRFHRHFLFFFLFFTQSCALNTIIILNHTYKLLANFLIAISSISADPQAN